MQKFLSPYVFLLLLLVCGIQQMLGQDRSNYQLLWEIKHKDSPKKSYLFGTMHIKDERAFKFSDAVIPAIKNSEAFALEVHPDSMNVGLVSRLFETDRENIYKRILNKKEYEKLAARFFEINQKSLDSFPMQHPYMIDAMLTKEITKDTDKRTFLDAYLYGIAFNLDKKIEGLEELEDQLPDLNDISDEELREQILELLDSDMTEQEAYFDDLVQLYYEGNIGKILLYANGFSALDEMLISRNKVMTTSMIEIMKTNSLFAAVGAAHLPGEDGIIELLKKEGFEVTKAPATFISEETNYVPRANIDKWYKNTNPELGFAVMTPSEPSEIELEKGARTMLSTDLLFGGVFAYLTIDLREKQLKEDYDFIENLVTNQTNSDTDSIISERRFTKDGIKMAELLVKKEDRYTRMLLAFGNKIAYTFFIENSQEDLTTPYADAFINSVQIFEPKILPAVWETKEDRIGGFAFEYPTPEVDKSKTAPNPEDVDGDPFELNIFSMKDKENEMLYLFRYNDQPLGYYLKNDTSFQNQIKDFLSNGGAMIGDILPIEISGYKGVEMEFSISNMFHARAIVVSRGNRSFLMLAQKLNDSGTVAKNDRFLRSFKLLPYEEPKLEGNLTIDNNFTLNFPKRSRKIKDSVTDAENVFQDETKYYGLDERTGACYYIETLTLRPYLQYESQEVFFDDFQSNLIELQDSVVSTTRTTLGGFPARELVIHAENTRVRQRMRFSQVGDRFIVLMAYVAEEELYSDAVENYFDSFKVIQKMKPYDISSSKSNLLFKNLRSSDSLTFEIAKGATVYYEFKDEDYKLLNKQLSNRFKDDSLLFSAKYNIIQNMLALETPKTLQDFKKVYLDKRTTNATRLGILEFMVELNNEDSFSTYDDLLRNHPPVRDPELPYDIFLGVQDNTSLLVENEKKFETLLAKDDYRDQIVNIYTHHILQDSIATYQTQNLKDKILSYFSEDTKRYVDTLARKNSPYLQNDLMNNYFEIIKDTQTKNTSIEEGLQHLSTQLEEANWYKTKAIITSIEIGALPNTLALEQKMDTLYSRFELMESIVRNKSELEIPKDYLAPTEFAKLSLYNSIGNMTSIYPQQIDLIGTITYKANTYAAYTYSFPDSDEKYLGVAEHKAPLLADFSMNSSYSDEIILEEDWRAQAQQLLENYSVE